MAPSVGVTGMVQLEYLGKQQSTIWDGPVTRTRYRFGVDRKIGWVDPRDVGTEGKDGFLALRDRNNNFLFRLVNAPITTEMPSSGSKTAPVPVGEPVLSVAAGTDTVSATVVEGNQEVLSVVADAATQEDAVSATVVVSADADFRYNPSEMYPSDIKRLNLNKEEWGIMYRLEMAGKNRQTVKTFIEEKLASDSESV